jgi:hypothetical protein
MPLFDRLRRGYAAAARIGWPDATVQFVSRVLEALTGGTCHLRRYYLVAQPVRHESQARVRRGQSIEVRRVHAGDTLVERFPRPRQEILGRFEQGSECFVAETGGVLAGFLWLHFGKFTDAEVRCVFVPLPREATCWDFDVFVDPGQRNGLAFFRLWQVASEYLAARGIRWTVSRVWAHNEASVASHRRLGALPVASSWLLTVGRLHISLEDSPVRLHWASSDRSLTERELDAAAAGAARFRRFRAA